jgi:hypothetical protein
MVMMGNCVSPSLSRQPAQSALHFLTELGQGEGGSCFKKSQLGAPSLKIFNRVPCDKFCDQPFRCRGIRC